MARNTPQNAGAIISKRRPANARLSDSSYKDRLNREGIN
jgi:hypothetical protein